MGLLIGHRLAAEMPATLSSMNIPAYIDSAAADFLEQGRAAYNLLGLEQSRFLQADKDTHILTWRGTDANSVLAFAVTSAGLECVVLDVGVKPSTQCPMKLPASFGRLRRGRPRP
ncbi:hypothetical protein [Mesorhizobium shangrilense]|uniref:Uncharacterized protein n=1 Tax=Mesorhizobium shangrilense TaxID=460060 RepID=A0ABV2DML0_9HYPH